MRLFGRLTFQQQRRAVAVAEDDGEMQGSLALRINVDGSATLEQLGHERLVVVDCCRDKKGVTERAHAGLVDFFVLVAVEPGGHLGHLVRLRWRWRQIA